MRFTLPLQYLLSRLSVVATPGAVPFYSTTLLIKDFGDQEIEQRMVDYLKEFENGQVVYNFGEAKTNLFSSSYLHYDNEATCVHGEISNHGAWLDGQIIRLPRRSTTS
jgi:hypothetical protein